MTKTSSRYQVVKGRLVVFIAAAAVYGCALPQKAERYHFGSSGAAESVSADRYAGQKGNPFDKLSVRLKLSAPFQFRFPDGYWANSREITRDTLIRHGVINENNRNDSYVAWHPALPIIASLVGRHQYFAFDLDKQGNPYQLHLGACGYSFDEILRTMDGERTYGFPLTVTQATELFGNPSKIEVFQLVTGFTCF